MTTLTPSAFCHANLLDVAALSHFAGRGLEDLMIAWRLENDAGNGDAWGVFSTSTPAEAVKEENVLLIREYADGTVLALTRDARLYLVCDSNGPWACEIYSVAF